MKFATWQLGVWVIATALTVNLAAQAGQGKRRDNTKKDDGNWPVTFAIEHAAELKLNEDQLKRLGVLLDFEDKVISDPGVKEMIAKLKQAKRERDEAARDEQKAHISAVIKERSGGQVASFVEALAKVLTPDQMTMFHALRNPNAKDGADTAPAAAGGLPVMKNPFDF